MCYIHYWLRSCSGTIFSAGVVQWMQLIEICHVWYVIPLFLIISEIFFFTNHPCFCSKAIGSVFSIALLLYKKAQVLYQILPRERNQCSLLLASFHSGFSSAVGITILGTRKILGPELWRQMALYISRAQSPSAQEKLINISMVL